MLANYLTLAFAFAVAVLFVYRKRKNSWKSLPNGPSGLPFLGNILQLGSAPHLQLSQWATQFGPYYTVNLAGKPMLVANSAKTIKSLFGNMPSTGKYEFELFDIVYSKTMGHVNAQGKSWLEHVKFTRKSLTSFGLTGGLQLESLILDECNELCEWIDENLKEGKNEMYFSKVFLRATSNLVWNMISGEKKRSRDSKLTHILEEYVAKFMDASILTFMPWLKHIAPKKSGYTDYVRATETLHNYVRETIAKRQKTRNSLAGEYVSTDLLDAYLDHVENSENVPESVFQGKKGLEETFYSLVGFIVAGSETTATSMAWTISYLVAYPDVQDKLRKEVDKVMGPDGNPTLVEKHRMPYLEAVIYEVLRLSSIVPLGVLHKLLEPVTFDGYALPKDMILLANVYGANRDPEIWTDPEKFKPERFMDGELEQRKHLRECVMTFQDGKRKCPGEQVAKDELFMLTARLVQKYKFAPTAGRERSEYIEPVVGYVLLPPKLDMLIIPRS